MVEIVAVSAFLGLIPAGIAQSKGHSFLMWWVFGALLFIVALPCAIFLSRAPTEKEQEDAKVVEGIARYCEACKAVVPREATKCRYCATELVPLPPAPEKVHFLG